MTYVTPGASPARLRIEAAGEAFRRRKDEAARDVQEARLRAQDEARRRGAEERRRQITARIETIFAHASVYRSFGSVVQAVAQLHGVGIAELCGDSRETHVVLARHEAMYLLRKAGKSCTRIGRFFNKDHTTVLHACRRHGERLARLERMKEWNAEPRPTVGAAR